MRNQKSDVADVVQPETAPVVASEAPAVAVEPVAAPLPSRPAVLGLRVLYRYAADDGCSPGVVGEQRPGVVVRENADQDTDIGPVRVFTVNVATAGATDFPAGTPPFMVKGTTEGDKPGQATFIGGK